MEDTDFTTCPYNPQHRMLKLRLQNHIVKCQKNYINADMKSCPYNATHIVRSQEYRQHIQSCPDFILIEGYRYNDDKPHGKLNEGAFHFDIIKEQDWESTNVTDTSSEVSANSSKECSQYFDWFGDYDEDEEPLQRLPGTSVLGSTESNTETHTLKEDNPNNGEIDERAGKILFQCGAGRGRLFSILAGLNKK